MKCRVCDSARTLPLWPNVEGEGGYWHICPGCGSHSHDVDPAAVTGDYLTPEYRDHLNFDGRDPSPTALTANVEWFAEHRKSRGRDFLDVGHLNGNGLRAMAGAGWSVHGFDVNPHGHLGEHTTIAPRFAASLFPRRYDAVLCREVIEHVEDWRDLLAELWKVVKRNGLVQVQTPRPTAEPHKIVHQRHHLQIFAPGELDRACRAAGFSVLDRMGWDIGQAIMLRPA